MIQENEAGEVTATMQVQGTVVLTTTCPDLALTDEEDIDEGLDRREAERAPLTCPTLFHPTADLASGLTREGTLLDLSKTGCKIYSLEPPAAGISLSLVLSLPDGLPPLYLIGTMVRHVDRREFGIEFPPLAPHERRRVQALIFKYLTWSVYSLRRPAFTFSEPAQS